MKSAVEEAADRLVDVWAALGQARDQLIADWKPDDVPITILFGAFGRLIAENFESLPDDVRIMLFEQIETEMRSRDELVGTAVATGLVESLVSTAALRGDLLKRVLRLLGSASRYHADCWRGARE